MECNRSDCKDDCNYRREIGKEQFKEIENFLIEYPNNKDKRVVRSIREMINYYKDDKKKISLLQNYYFNKYKRNRYTFFRICCDIGIITKYVYQIKRQIINRIAINLYQLGYYKNNIEYDWNGDRDE